MKHIAWRGVLIVVFDLQYAFRVCRFSAHERAQHANFNCITVFDRYGEQEIVMPMHRLAWTSKLRCRR